MWFTVKLVCFDFAVFLICRNPAFAFEVSLMILRSVRIVHPHGLRIGSFRSNKVRVGFCDSEIVHIYKPGETLVADGCYGGHAAGGFLDGVAGLELAGDDPALAELVDRVFGGGLQGLFEAATYMDLRRLPELFCGFQRERRRGPTLYPVACAPQAWASATPFSLIEAALGLEFRPQTNEIHLRNPRLPKFLDEVILRNLQVGGSSIDLKVRRHADDVSLEVLQARGKIQASVILSA